MRNNVLLIVEGSVDEKNIFQGVFARYGFHTIVAEEKLNIDEVGQLSKYHFCLDQSNVVIIEGPRNRIHDFLKLYNENEMSIERFFAYSCDYFSGIFLIYDVDHNDCEDVQTMFDRFADESSGMLLLSSPCIEVIADYDRQRGESKYHHLKEYKADIHAHYQGSVTHHIVDCFDECMLYFLRKNHDEFLSENIMDHPKLVMQAINAQNDRVNCKDQSQSYVIYRYFSTVVYVAIAFAHGLTKEINNYPAVETFFCRLGNQTTNSDSTL